MVRESEIIPVVVQRRNAARWVEGEQHISPSGFQRARRLFGHGAAMKGCDCGDGLEARRPQFSGGETGAGVFFCNAAKAREAGEAPSRWARGSYERAHLVFFTITSPLFLFFHNYVENCKFRHWCRFSFHRKGGVILSPTCGNIFSISAAHHYGHPNRGAKEECLRDFFKRLWKLPFWF